MKTNCTIAAGLAAFFWAAGPIILASPHPDGVDAPSNEASLDTARVHGLDEVVVTGARAATDPRRLPVTVSVVGRQTLTAAGHQNIMPSINQEVPGLFVTSRGMLGYGVSGGGAGALSIRGLAGSTGQIMVLVDGHPQYNGLYGHPVSDVYQTFTAEKVEVVRGPASVLYGSNALGGVINIVTRQQTADGLRIHASAGGGSYGTAQAEAEAQLKTQLKSGALSGTLAAQYARSDNHRPRMGFDQYGAFLKAVLQTGNHWEARADGYINHFNAEHPGTVLAPMLEAKQWITRGTAALTISNRHDRARGALSVYTNFGRHKINDGYAANGGKPQTELFRSKDALSGFNLYQVITPSAGTDITVGLDYQHIYGNAYYTSRATGEVVTAGMRGMQSGRAHMNEWAAYADVRQELAERLTIEAGVRLDRHSVSGTEVIPTAGLAFRPNDAAELKFVYAKGFRNPTTKDMYLYKVANAELEAERVQSFDLGWQLRRNGMTLKANLFYIKGDNMIQAVSVVTDPATGATAMRNMNAGVVENRGAEIEASAPVGERLRLTTNHSFLRMKNPTVSSPEYKGFVGVDARMGRFGGQVGLQQLAGLYINVSDKSGDKTRATLLSANANARLAERLTLWVRGENLLACEYETMEGYPMPKATVMVGLKVYL